MKKNANYLIILFAAMLPLWWGLHKEGLWSDELYSILYSQEINSALLAEPHLPLIFVWIRLFVEIFGQESFWLRLSSLVPISLSLVLMFKLCLKSSRLSLAPCLFLVLVLNPIFLQFSRSIRGNYVLYISPLLIVWVLVEVRPSLKYWMIFFVTFISGLFFLVAAPVSWLTLLTWGVISKKQDGRAHIVAGLANGLLALIVYIKYHLGGFWPPSFYLVPEIKSFERITRYFFTYAEETFSFNWDTFYYGLSAHDYLYWHVVMIMSLLCATIIYSAFYKKEIFRIQFILVIFSMLYLILLWSLGLLGFSVILPRTHLFLFLLIQLSLGLGFYAIVDKSWGKCILVAYAFVSIVHLKNISFYEVQPQEVSVIRLAASYAKQKRVVSCFYPQKMQLLGVKDFISNCHPFNLKEKLKIETDVVLVDEFYNPGTKEAIEFLRTLGFRLTKIETFHYSKLYHFKKDD